MSERLPGTPVGFRYDEQSTPPSPERVSDVALTTHPHLFEVDPRLMQRWVLQQEFPNWDSLRIMSSRADHLEWMHRHFADRVVTGSELLSEIDVEGGEGGAPGISSRPATNPGGRARQGGNHEVQLRDAPGLPARRVPGLDQEG
jgi:hypothetical protein